MSKFKPFLVLSLLGAALALAGCATAQPERGDAMSKYDAAYIGAVNRSAKRQSLRVIWVNPPVKEESSIEVKIK